MNLSAQRSMVLYLLAQLAEQTKYLATGSCQFDNGSFLCLLADHTHCAPRTGSC